MATLGQLPSTCLVQLMRCQHDIRPVCSIVESLAHAWVCAQRSACFSKSAVLRMWRILTAKAHVAAMLQQQVTYRACLAAIRQ